MGVDGVLTPPYRIETERLVLRCYDPADAQALRDAVDTSREHLAQWMPWARGPQSSFAETMQLLRTFRGDFDLDTNYVYGVFARDESRVLGGAGLHPRGGTGSLEIGYWIRRDAARQGYATETAAALARVGFEVCGLARVDVQIDVGNEASLGVARKLGFTRDGVIRHRLDPLEDGGPRRDSVFFTMLSEQFAASPCAAYDYVAYDAAGNRLVSDTSGA